MWRCEDVKVRRCEDCEGVSLWRCEDEKMWVCEDVNMWRFIANLQFLKKLRSDALGKKRRTSNKLNDPTGSFLSALEFGHGMTQLRFSFFGKARHLWNFEFWLSVSSRKGVFMQLLGSWKSWAPLPSSPQSNSSSTGPQTDSWPVKLYCIVLLRGASLDKPLQRDFIWFYRCCCCTRKPAIDRKEVEIDTVQAMQVENSLWISFAGRIRPWLSMHWMHWAN